MLAMFSAENEKVKFVKPIDPLHKNVEDWMNEVEEMMKSSVREALYQSIIDYPKRKRYFKEILYSIYFLLQIN